MTEHGQPSPSGTGRAVLFVLLGFVVLAGFTLVVVDLWQGDPGAAVGPALSTAGVVLSGTALLRRRTRDPG